MVGHLYNEETQTEEQTFSNRMGVILTLGMAPSIAASDNRRMTSVSQSTLLCNSASLERRFLISSAICHRVNKQLTTLREWSNLRPLKNIKLINYVIFENNLGPYIQTRWRCWWSRELPQCCPFLFLRFLYKYNQYRNGHACWETCLVECCTALEQLALLLEIWGQCGMQCGGIWDLQDLFNFVCHHIGAIHTRKK